MHAVILSVVLGIVCGGVIWITLGTRMKVNTDPVQNEILNVMIYVLGSFVIIFCIIFFGIA